MSLLEDDEGLPQIIEIVLTASNHLGGSSSGNDASGDDGFELTVSFKERKVRLPLPVFERSFPFLLKRWRKKMTFKRYKYDPVTGHCVPAVAKPKDTLLTQKVDETALVVAKDDGKGSQESSSEKARYLRVANVRLTMPSALFADCFAEALTMPALYPVRPATQFSWYSIACMLNNEARLLQCERFIANSLCTGTVVFALQHASRFGRNHLLHLCYQWLRRTGGVTPGYLLLHPERQLRVDVSAGLLYQWDPTAKEYTFFDLTQLAEVVAAERSRKRKFYIPIKTVSYDALKHSTLALKLAADKPSGSAPSASAGPRKIAPVAPDDDEAAAGHSAGASPAPAAAAAETAASASLPSSTLFSDVDLGIAPGVARDRAESRDQQQSRFADTELDALAATHAGASTPAGAVAGSGGVAGWEDVSLLSPKKAGPANGEPASPAAAVVESTQSGNGSNSGSGAGQVVAGFVTNDNVTAVAHPGIAHPFKASACISVEVGSVREQEFVACTEGDRGVAAASSASASAATGIANASTSSATAAPGTSQPSAAPATPSSQVPSADGQRLFSGPGQGWPELMRCYIVRRRDGRGPGRVCRSATLEWQGVVASRLGLDGDENASETTASAGAGAISAAPGSTQCCPARGGNHAVIRRTCFDDAEIATAAADSAPSSLPPSFVSQPVPCPYHDGARPYHKKEEVAQWELGPRLFAAMAARTRGYYYRNNSSQYSNRRHYQNYADPFSEEFSEHAYAHSHDDESDLSDDEDEERVDDPSSKNKGTMVLSKDEQKKRNQQALQALFRSGAQGGWLNVLTASENLDEGGSRGKARSKELVHHQRSRFPRKTGDDPVAFGKPPTLAQLRWLRRRCTCTSNLYSSPPSHLGAALSNALTDTAPVASTPEQALGLTSGSSVDASSAVSTTGAAATPGTFAAAASQYSGTSAVKGASVVPGNADALGPSGSRHVFELRREIDDSLIAVAVCTGTGGKFNFFTASHPLMATSAHNSSGGVAPSDPYSYLGTTSCNLMGTCITLYDWGMPFDIHSADPNMPPGERPIPTLPMMLPPGTDVGAGPAGPLLGHPCGFLPSLGQRELARILYDSNILASAPNRMTVELRHHDDYDTLDLLRAKALGRQSAGAAGGSAGASGGSASSSDPTTSSLSRVALYGLPPEATAQPGETSLITLRAAGSSSSSSNDGAGGGSSGAGGGGFLAEIPNLLPKLSLTTGGLLSKPQDLDLRVCTPSTGFGIGLGASSGVGSWSGMLSSAWSSVVGAVSGSSSAATEAAAGTAGLQGLTAAVTVVSAKSPSISSSDKAAAAAAVTSAAMLATGADAVKPYAVLMTRKPRWSDRLDAWTMDFRGRVVKASKKNFQLVAVPLAHSKREEDADIYVTDHSSAPALLFGKVAKDRYSLDFAPGCLGPMQAFCIALSTFASKLAVA